MIIDIIKKQDQAQPVMKAYRPGVGINTHKSVCQTATEDEIARQVDECVRREDVVDVVNEIADFFVTVSELFERGKHFFLFEFFIVENFGIKLGLKVGTLTFRDFPVTG